MKNIYIITYSGVGGGEGGGLKPCLLFAINKQLRQKSLSNQLVVQITL